MKLFLLFLLILSTCSLTCHYSCKANSCISPNNASACTQCLDTDQRVHSDPANPGTPGLCSCQTGFYDNNQPICQSCSKSCQTCLTKNQCLTCKPSSFRTLKQNDNTCPCDPKYVDNGNQNCVSCHITCGTCDGIQQNNCIDCNQTTSFRQKNSSNYCQCKQKYYHVTNQFECQLCHYSCSTCQGNELICTSCNSTKNRVKVNDQCKCKDKYYDDLSNQQCKICHHSCATCVSLSTNCSSCSSSIRIQSVSGSNTKQCLCPIRKYDDGVNEACVSCHYSCYTCTNNTDCVTCSQGTDHRVYNSSTKKCSCIAGYLNVDGVSQCQKCNARCFYCSQINNHLKCTTCNGTANRYADFSNGNQGQCKCKIGYFQKYTDPNNIIQQCSSCSIKCQSCSAQNTCLSCNSSNFRAGISDCNCMAGYYQNNTATCAKCSYKCGTCTSSTNCQTCSDVNRPNTPNCQCKINKYDAGIAECKSCPENCQTCTNPNNCTSCSGDRVLLNAQCVCKTKYFENSSNECQQCHNSCAQCSATGDNKCTKCDLSLNRILNGNKCDCLLGYYGNSLTTCNICHYSCQTCQDADQLSCISCNSTSQRTSSLLPFPTSCQCKAKFYDDGINQLCKSCHYSCATCDNETKNIQCKTCNNANKRVNNSTTKLCDCEIGYYDNHINQACPICHYTCKTCSSSSLSSCLSCDQTTNFRKLLLNGTCPCLQGYFDSGSLAICSVCSKSCLTCFTTGKSGCSSCLSSNFRQLKTTNCSCLIGYFQKLSQNNASCSPCSSKCLSCSQNQQDCTSCSLSNNRQLIGLQCKCKAGYWDDGTAACVKCHYSCLTCDNAISCKSCDSTKLRKPIVTGNLCQCNDKTYNNGTNMQCVPCSYRCQSCDSSGCTSCDSTRQPSGSDCLCKLRYFDDGASNDCKKCHYSCLTCTNLSACTSCDSSPAYNRILNSSTKYCSCLTSYYDYQTSLNRQVCQSCEPKCLTCINDANTCRSCRVSNNRNLVNNKCQCLTGYFQYSNDITCKKCHYKCSSCLTDQNSCTSCSGSNFRNPTDNCACNDGYYDSGVALCVACQYSCTTCQSSSKCLQCDSTRGDVNNSPVDGVCACIEGYYDNKMDKVCPKCKDTCKTCNNGNNCTSCDGGTNTQNKKSFRTLINSACVCLDKYFQNAAGVCTKCKQTCKSCIQQLKCSQCDLSNNRVLNSLTNQCDCLLSHYKETQQKCLPCHYTCYSCTGSGDNQCLTCSSNHFRQENSLSPTTCTCIDGYFDDGSSNQLCQKCHHSCKTCSLNANNCTDCDTDSSSNRVNNSINGLCDCKQYTYDDEISKNCLLCPYQCGSCLNSTQCFTCDSTHLRHPSQDGKTCQCNIGYYDDGQNSSCKACDYSCLTCSSKDSCLSCNSTQGRQLGVNCTCIIGYYQKTNVQACSKCLPECYNCTNDISCITCPQFSGRQQKDDGSGNIRCVCKNGYFDQGLQNCGICHYSCQTCIASNKLKCDTCNSIDSYRTKGSDDLCKCKDTYYDNGTKICEKCHYSCLTCTNSSSNTCLLCPSGSHRTINSGSCVCNKYYYDILDTPTCGKCDYSCQKCDNTTNCTSCDSTKNRYLSTSTMKCLCTPGYYNLTPNTQQCSKCRYSCATCSSYTTCDTCDALNFRILKSTQCQCMDGYYNEGSDPKCKPCHISCKTCVTATACTSCQPLNNWINPPTATLCQCLNKFYNDNTATCKFCNYTCETCTQVAKCATCSLTNNRQKISGNNFCTCQLGFFDTNSNIQKCQKCSYTCQTCTNVAINCTTCNSNYHRTILQGTLRSCPCDQYYYDASSVSNQDDRICAKCHFTCSKCIQADKCSSCNATRFRIKDTSNDQCKCLDGYFNNNVQTCVKCDHSCQTCDKAGQCLTCGDTFSHRQLNPDDKCLCKPQYYDNGVNLVCSSCLYQCQTCIIGSQCSSCKETTPQFRKYNTSTKRCNCQKYYYDDGLNNMNCQSCHYSCDTCTNGSACATCSQGVNFRFMNTTTKHCQCLSNYFQIVNQKTCQLCHVSCLTCSAAGDNCVTCNTLHNRVQDGTQCKCKDGFYNQVGNGVCKACNISCATCSDGTSCMTCNSSYNRVSTTVDNQCPCLIRFYDDLQHMNCPSCHYSCQKCTNATSCLTCDSTKKRTQNGDKCVCIQGYFDNGNSQECQVCSYKCVTCSTTKNNCTSCDLNINKRTTTPSCNCLDKFYDESSGGTEISLCDACHYSCAKCTSGYAQTQCTSCNSTKQRTYVSGKCVCKPGYFDDSSSQDCAICSYKCLTCQSSLTQCLTCNVSHHRTLSGTNCPCNQYYFDNNVGLCASCHYSCQTCSTSSIQCDNCNSTNHRQMNLTTHLCSCSIGYFDNGTSNQMCTKCHDSCLACNTAASCINCTASQNRTLNSTANFKGQVSAYCICVYGFYAPTNLDTCSPCHYSCQVCNGTTNNDCQLCSNEYHRTLSGRKCICNDGYYDDGSNSKCQICQSQCSKCTGPGSEVCQSCNAPYYFTPIVTTCNESCGARTYINESNRICESCPTNCQQCSSPTICTKCDTSYFFIQTATGGTSCIDTCPIDHYGEVTNRTCVKCSNIMDQCTKCSSLTICQSCETGYVLKSPPTGCDKCNQNCLTCNGIVTNCTDCNYPLFLQIPARKCIEINCSENQYPNSLLGCVNCISQYPNSYSCNNTSPLTCISQFAIINNECINCTTLPGFIIINSICQQICGDGINYNNQGCDDGNLVDGDGCSSKCTVQEGWKCSNTVPTTYSICLLTAVLELKMQSIKKLTGENQLVAVFTTNMPIKLTESNTIVILTNNALESYTIKMISLTQYQFNIYYKATVQSTTLTITLNINRARLLMQSQSMRLLQATTFDFSFQIDSYPPAIYYPTTINDTFNGIGIFLHIVCAITLALSFIGLIGIKRIVFYSMQLFNFMVILYILQGIGLNNRSDWIEFSIPTMRYYTLLGGFAIGICNCLTNSDQYAYGYNDQLFQNAGIIIVIDAFILLSLGIIYGIYRARIQDLKQKKVITFSEKLWIFGKYYVFAFLLIFNANVAFSSFLTILNASTQTNIAIINIIFAVIILALSITFLIGLFFWTKQLLVPIIFPQPKQEIQNIHIGGHDKSSAILSGNHSRRHASEVREGDKYDEKSSNPIQRDSYFDGDSQDDSKKSDNVFATPVMKQNNPIIQISSIQLQAGIEQRNSVQAEEQIHDEYQHPKYYRMMMSDFVDIFNDEIWGKFYPFIYSILLFCTLIFVGFLRQHHIPKYSILIVLHLAFLIYVILKKPFISKFNNFKSIGIQIIILALLALDLSIVANSHYYYGMQLAIMIIIPIALVANICAYVVQVFYSYYKQISQYFGFAKNQQIKVIADDTPKIEEDHDKKIQKVEMDAFFQRVLKKNKINKQYRKERRLKAN